MNLSDELKCLWLARKVCSEQAEDEGLWFEAETAPEAYLQQELRRLHAVIERDDSAFKGAIIELENE